MVQGRAYIKCVRHNARIDVLNGAVVHVQDTQLCDSLTYNIPGVGLTPDEDTLKWSLKDQAKRLKGGG